MWVTGLLGIAHISQPWELLVTGELVATASLVAFGSLGALALGAWFFAAVAELVPEMGREFRTQFCLRGEALPWAESPGKGLDTPPIPLRARPATSRQH